MRRRTKQMERLKVKILEDRGNGLTYKQIEAKRGVSSRTIRNVIKKGDPKRSCGVCAVTDPEMLNNHHPDRKNRPKETKVLCANHHAKKTGEQQRERMKKKEADAGIQDCFPMSNAPTSPPVSTSAQTPHPERPLTLEEQRLMRKGLCYVLGTSALAEGLFDKRMPDSTRLLFGIIGIALLYGGYKQ